MSAWSLVFVPASLGMIVLLLVTVSWIEQRVLTPRVAVAPAAPAESAAAEKVEPSVADQARGLLAGLARPTPADGSELVELAAKPQ